MATTIIPGDELFLDSSFAIALAAENDQLHQRALKLAMEIKAAGTRLVCTSAVLLEIGNALGRARYRSAAIRLLQSLESDPSVRIVSVTDELYLRALHLYS